MNKLSIEQQTIIVKALCEGNSIRSTARMTGVAINTVVKLLKELGRGCLDYQDKAIRNLPSRKLQCDEIWSFVYAKANHIPKEHDGEFGFGDVWTFTAIDADTKLVPSWKVGPRTVECASEFVADLKERLANRVQITTDGHGMYLEAVERNFGQAVDYAQLVKLYGSPEEKDKRYSPSECIGAEKHVITGKPEFKEISTSYVERQNLTMRMCMRRFTRLTNAFSKKLENHVLALALYFVHYNFVKTHKSLANPYPRTPAMAAKLTDHIWTTEELVKLTSQFGNHQSSK
jgi:IS1 family transposase